MIKFVLLFLCKTQDALTTSSKIQIFSIFKDDSPYILVVQKGAPMPMEYFLRLYLSHKDVIKGRKCYSLEYVARSFSSIA